MKDTANIRLNKYNSITFWRVVFTFAIVIFHFGRRMSGFNAMYHTKNGWRIGVEFFFILSGFLLAYKSSTSKMTAIEFTKHKIARLFPEYFVMILYCIPLKCVLKSMDLKEFVIYIFSSLDDLLFLNGTGIAYNEISGAVWYISALVICGYFIYYLYNKWREVFVSLIAPASVLYIYTFFSRSRGELTGATHITSLNISAALLRGWAGIALGVLAYEIYVKLQDINFTKAATHIMHFVEIMGFVAVLVFSSYLGSTKKDFLYVILFFICVILGFLRKEKNILLHNPVIGYLGKLSYTIYLSHGFIRDLLAEKIGGGYV